MRNLEIGICLYSTSVCFGFSNRLYSLSSEKQKVKFGLQVFMQLVFGFHSVTWAVKQAGQYVPGELVLILDVLFHYKHNRIVGSDYFLSATAQAAFASSSANSHRRSSKASNCLCVSVYCRSCSSTHSSDARCRDVVPCSLES
jgi:hypothetical protein